MKNLLLVFVAVLSLLSCSSNSNSKKENTPMEITESDKIEVLYFHSKKRCITCNAIESLSKEVIQKINNPDISYKIIDISTEEGEKIADQYEVAWSSLLINNKGTILDLTKLGFSHAKNQPDVFKQKLEESINSIL